MERGYRYRIYPTREQQELMAKTFGCCRFVYNRCLDRKKTLYETEKTSLSRTECNNWCNRELKAEFEWLREVDKFALTNAIYDMDSAYKKFFRENAGYPKFRSKHGGHNSYKTNLTNGNIAVDFDSNHIKLPKLGSVKARLHRRFEGQIKNVTVSMSPSGKYFASVCVDAPVPEFSHAVNVIGLDMGLKSLCVTSTGVKYNSPEQLDRLSLRLKRMQHDLSRKKKGSSNYDKQKHRIAITHERIANIRKDNLHKLTRALVDENQVIVSENLNVKGMMRNHHLAFGIASASWSELMRQLDYKSSWYGRMYIKVDAFFPSSQLCSCCGYQNASARNLSIRKWTCPVCGAFHDRDVNAAENILMEGLRKEGIEKYIGQGLPEYKPVDQPTMDERSISCLRSRAGMKQEAHRL